MWDWTRMKYEGGVEGWEGKEGPHFLCANAFNTPFTNLALSAVPYSLATSMASFITTAGGTSTAWSSSYAPMRRIQRVILSMRSHGHCGACDWIASWMACRSVMTP